MQADVDFRLQPEDIRNLYVRNNKGEVVPLGTMITVHPIAQQRTDHPLQSLSGGGGVRRRRARLQLRRRRST